MLHSTLELVYPANDEPFFPPSTVKMISGGKEYLYRGKIAGFMV